MPVPTPRHQDAQGIDDNRVEPTGWFLAVQRLQGIGQDDSYAIVRLRAVCIFPASTNAGQNQVVGERKRRDVMVAVTS
jgi:hypothetical protein